MSFLDGCSVCVELRKLCIGWWLLQIMSKILLFHYLRGALSFSQLTGINKYTHINQKFLLPPEHVGHNLTGKASSSFFPKLSQNYQPILYFFFT